MAVRHRSSPPPYQVMKPSPPTGARRGDSSPQQGGGPGTLIPSAPGTRLSLERRLAAWWNSLRMPLATRITQGMALVLLWVVLVVILLAYLVGYAQGVRHGRDQVRPDGAPVVPGLVVPPSPGPTAGFGPAVVPGPATPGPAAGPDNKVDPRQEGMAYFIVASYSIAKPEVARKEARDLVVFLQSKAVDAAAILPHNGRSYEVAVLRPFAPQERSGPAAEEFKQRLRQLGEEYVRLHRSGFDLKSLYPKIQGITQAPDDVLTKENIP
jgi:hypothetical protein